LTRRPNRASRRASEAVGIPGPPGNRRECQRVWRFTPGGPLSSAGFGDAVLSPPAVTDRDPLLVFRNVRSVDPSTQLDARVDVVIEGQRITKVGPAAGAEAARADGARVIDGDGRWLLPAFVEMHAHLREPGYEYKEDIGSGLAAGAAGGYAHVCAMPNTKPVNDHRTVTEFMLLRAAECGGARLHPIAAITKGQQGKELSEMAELREAGAVAVSDDGACVMSSSVMRRALEYAHNFGLLVIQHPEDHDLTGDADMHEGAVSTRLGLRGAPRVAEDAIVARDLMLAHYVGAPYHAAHVSTAGTVELFRQAKARGQAVSCEVTPHHLLLTDATVARYDALYKVKPPLREDSDLEAVRAALADGTIDAIATDHAPHADSEKDCEFSAASPGMIGLELCFPLCLSLVEQQVLTLSRLIDALSTRPAKLLGLEPPSLREGALAEVVLVDPEHRWCPRETGLRSKSRNSPFMNDQLCGRVLMTLAGGRIVYDGVGVS